MRVFPENDNCEAELGFDKNETRAIWAFNYISEQFNMEVINKGILIAAHHTRTRAKSKRSTFI